MYTTLSSVMEVLGNAEVSALDSARFVRNILDAKPSDSKLTDAQFVLKVIEVGLRHIRTKEMSFANGFNLYYETKKDILRPDTSTCKTSPKPTPKSFSAEQGGAMVRVSMCSLPI